MEQILAKDLYQVILLIRIKYFNVGFKKSIIGKSSKLFLPLETKFILRRGKRISGSPLPLSYFSLLSSLMAMASLTLIN